MPLKPNSCTQRSTIAGQSGSLGGPGDCFWVWDSDGNVKFGFPYGTSHGGGSEGPISRVGRPTDNN